MNYTELRKQRQEATSEALLKVGRMRNTAENLQHQLEGFMHTFETTFARGSVEGVGEQYQAQMAALRKMETLMEQMVALREGMQNDYRDAEHALNLMEDDDAKFTRKLDADFREYLEKRYRWETDKASYRLDLMRKFAGEDVLITMAKSGRVSVSLRRTVVSKLWEHEDSCRNQMWDRIKAVFPDAEQVEFYFTHRKQSPTYVLKFDPKVV